MKIFSLSLSLCILCFYFRKQSHIFLHISGFLYYWLTVFIKFFFNHPIKKLLNNLFFIIYFWCRFKKKSFKKNFKNKKEKKNNRKMSKINKFSVDELLKNDKQQESTVANSSTTISNAASNTLGSFSIEQFNLMRIYYQKLVETCQLPPIPITTNNKSIDVTTTTLNDNKLLDYYLKPPNTSSKKKKRMMTKKKMKTKRIYLK